MNFQLEQRLTELKDEFQAGQKRLAELQTKEASLRNTLLRIADAIQVPEEELAREDQARGNGVQTAEAVAESAAAHAT